MKTVVSLDPLSDLRQVNDVMEKLFGHSAAGEQFSHANQNIHLPVDIFEKDGALLVRAAVPGVSPEEVHITLEGDVLTIQGEMTESHEMTEAKVYRREYRTGKFTRSVRLPKNLDTSKITAEFDNGFVTVRLPKLEESKPNIVKVVVQNKAAEQA